MTTTPSDTRRDAGKAARATAPRRSHAAGPSPAPTRDPVAILEHQATGRVPELVPIRYGRMLISPFTFFRGAAAIMAADLADSPRSGLMVQACGDAHLLNFGLFGSPERRLVFDINDFDETAPGPWEWDVKRLLASLEIAARDRGFNDRERRSILLAAAQNYRQAMTQFATMRSLDVWYASVDVRTILDRVRAELGSAVSRRTKATINKSLTHDSLRAQRKLTRLVDGHRRIVSDPPLVVPIEEVVRDPYVAANLVDLMRRLLGEYAVTLDPPHRHLLSNYTYEHMARKVVGVGSVGTRSWIVLMRGRSDADPLLLQVKQAVPSVLEAYTGTTPHHHAGERVVMGQRMMQASSDIFLGWVRSLSIEGDLHDYYVRQLHDWKGSMDVESMAFPGLRAYGGVCSWTLARAHARSGDRVAIAGYLGKGSAFDEAVVAYASAYADQNDRDYATFAAAVASGQLPRPHRGLIAAGRYTGGRPISDRRVPPPHPGSDAR